MPATDTPSPEGASPAPSTSAAGPAPAARGSRASPQDAAALASLLGADSPRPWWKRRGPWLGLLALLLLAAVAAGWSSDRQAQAGPSFITEPITRGDVRLTVSATGTLEPTRTVEVGSELSGTVARVLVDLNDRVTKGQVLVELDTAKFGDQVERSRASLASRRAAVAQAQATVQEARSTLARYEEVSRLSGGKVPSRSEIDTAQAALERAQADLQSAQSEVRDAQAALRTDETNLSKASIRSPIDGVVLTRSADPGNAVAASLQAVTLFTIAEDLTRLTLEVNVDEADVGAVDVGQTASFTVSAWPDRHYPATIRRVAFGATTTDNVVTYVTYLDVANEDLTLRPGMTASATIVATEHEGVLTVPSTALRFTPALQTAGTGTGTAGATSGGGILSRLMPRPPSGGLPRNSPPADGSKQVWVLRDGRPEAVTVQVGLSDGRRTEVQGAGLGEGTPVIVDQRAGSRS